MKDHPEEKRGRRWLAALLLLNLLLTALERTMPVWPYRSGPVLLLTAAGLLPTAVVLWGLLRGSWPALAVFCIGAVRGVGDLVGLLQFGGVSALDRATALTLVVLLSRITVLLALFRQDDVSRYWERRRLRRRRGDLVLEAVLFLSALVLPLLLGALLQGAFSSGNL